MHVQSVDDGISICNYSTGVAAIKQPLYIASPRALQVSVRIK